MKSLPESPYSAQNRLPDLKFRVDPDPPDDHHFTERPATQEALDVRPLPDDRRLDIRPLPDIRYTTSNFRKPFQYPNPHHHLIATYFDDFGRLWF